MPSEPAYVIEITQASDSKDVIWDISNRYYSSRIKLLPVYNVKDAISQGTGCPAVLVLTDNIEVRT